MLQGISGCDVAEVPPSEASFQVNLDEPKKQPQQTLHWLFQVFPI